MTQPGDTAPQTIDFERLDALVRSLTIEERARLTAGIDAWHAAGVDSIGLGPMLTQDGPNGVRGTTFPEGSSATCTPCGTGLGATWDADLVAEVAARIGAEAKRADVHYMLGPDLNLVRSPLAGRDFECFSEDPVLAARLGVAYVSGMQSQRVAACPKHFVANDSETHRTTVNCVVDERTLREVYLRPFEAAARAGAWSMMAAYNLVNGLHCTGNRALIGTILRDEWGWDGVLMSDWQATQDTDEATAGLDLEMPGPPHSFGPLLAAAVRRGDVGEETLNRMAMRVLTLAARVGALPDGRDEVPGRKAAGGDRIGSAAPFILSDPEAAALVRRAAADSFVLLANDGILPLAAAQLERIAVIGPNAAAPCTQGGGAAHIDAPYAVSPLEGLRAALPESVHIAHQRGCGIDLFLPPLMRMDLTDLDGNPGLTVEFFRGQEPRGVPVSRYNVRSSDLHLFGDLPAGLPQNDFAVRLSAWLTPRIGGPHQVSMRGLGGRRLFVDGVPAADEWAAPAGIDVPTALFEGNERGGAFVFEAGQRVLITGEAHSGTHHPSVLSIGCSEPESGDSVASAVSAAAAAEVAIVVVGTDEAWESEGRDRKTVTLPGRQNELVERVAAVNRKTIVVVNAGCPMDLPWAGDVAAVIYAWFPGQEFGHALADVLLGMREPGGRLPVTLARGADDFPAYDTTPGPDEELVYRESVNIGYRGFDAAGTEPRFPFGHGLGYTTFDYESLDLRSDGPAEGQPVELRVKLRNTGSRPGKEVVQVYVADLESSVP
ncbi:MAG TPA: glycoside hydrolase family 3 C-terminal domain-containing protein, partial [Candidatus Limnocylindrales bacterium]